MDIQKLDWSKLSEMPAYAPTGPGRYVFSNGAIEAVTQQSNFWVAGSGFKILNDGTMMYSNLRIVAPAPEVLPWEECERLNRELEDSDRNCEAAIIERDEHAEYLDKFVSVLGGSARHGEHSNANDPWQNSIIYAGSIEQKLQDVEKHARSVEAINSHLVKQIKQLEAERDEWKQYAEILKQAIERPRSEVSTLTELHQKQIADLQQRVAKLEMQRTGRCGIDYQPKVVPMPQAIEPLPVVTEEVQAEKEVV